MHAHAHAKVNLHLGVGPARPDGFHELATVFQSLAIHDVVQLELADAPSSSPRHQLQVAGPYAAGVPTDASNLAWRAVDAVAAYLRREHGALGLPAVSLRLHKSIPAAGGMAGGSADAAATLRLAAQAYAEYLGVEVPGDSVLQEMAADLGSDVPFTLLGGTALGTGRGEALSPMLARGQYHWAIITSVQGLSTPAVFAKLDQLRAAGRGSQPHLDTADISRALISGSAEQVAAALHNDLQAAALSLRPDLRKVLDTGEAAGALRGIVSGSGPTCAFLCEDAETAAEVVAQVSADNRGTRGMVTHSPAPGARVLA
ncbi:4-(cytidine 5'-diphospho)-2-C-methyl-D-erythritol kinase [Corynebacterium lizhenjunii]|uniref:4-diphosphocytidyl-2-C-methyl-D-erythritol kinase n=1 Tax=Corynebacterium lizhenjunii TaxID=2709394 RepID=A0A7T0KH23_9CORY|nr:4-(cytidine 5'-diphospho)-2-C-methyl-D-erythritol kinase [Corynebacterium lizhenjunii]QPK79819.1 4-(cytidine 5'-diphospho)-2-C-methyl-D-erythritol kinase [Corynebacterium lizhenjunii]